MKLPAVNNTVKQVKQIPKPIFIKPITYEPGSMNLPALPAMSPKLYKAVTFVKNLMISAFH